MGLVGLGKGMGRMGRRWVGVGVGKCIGIGIGMVGKGIGRVG